MILLYHHHYRLLHLCNKRRLPEREIVRLAARLLHVALRRLGGGDDVAASTRRCSKQDRRVDDIATTPLASLSPTRALVTHTRTTTSTHLDALTRFSASFTCARARATRHRPLLLLIATPTDARPIGGPEVAIMRRRAALAALLVVACAAPCAATFAVERAGVRVRLFVCPRSPTQHARGSPSARPPRARQDSHPRAPPPAIKHARQVVYPTSAKGNRYVR